MYFFSATAAAVFYLSAWQSSIWHEQVYATFLTFQENIDHLIPSSFLKPLKIQATIFHASPRVMLEYVGST